MKKKAFPIILCFIFLIKSYTYVASAIDINSAENNGNEKNIESLVNESTEKNSKDNLDINNDTDYESRDINEDDANIQIEEGNMESTVQYDNIENNDDTESKTQSDNKEIVNNIESHVNLKKKSEISDIENSLSNSENIEENTEKNDIRLMASSTKNEDFSVWVNVEGNTINPYIKEDIYYLFIPKSADLSNLIINYTGNIIEVNGANLNSDIKQITGIYSNESNITIKLAEGEKKLVIMQSDVPAIFVNLDNETTLETVNSNSKSLKYKGSLNVLGCDDSHNNISQSEIEFKGRGNTSWEMPKRGYQIKLKSKANFLGIGTSKEKKWVLIANYQDPTLLKNKIMNDLGVNSGLSTCPNSEFADLYVNGDYVGNYLICDKIEINSKRINLKDKKGVLIELDNAYYGEENYKFVSKRGNHYVVKEAVSEDDDFLTMQAMNSFKYSLDAFEDELYSDAPSWQKISKMIDVESFAKYYLINEFAENTDSYYSSCFLYKDGDDDIIHMGPVWDYDAAFGYSNNITKNTNIDYTINYAWKNDMQRLYIFPEFASLVNEVYNRDVKKYLNQINVMDIANKIEKSSEINAIVWLKNNTYNNYLGQLNTYVEARKKYFNSRYSNQRIEYSTHVQNIGWLISKGSGVSGTEGQSYRLEALKVKIGSGYGENISVSYRAHVQNIGWQKWVSDGQLAGTTGNELRMEAVQLKLNNPSKYSIRYRVHIENIGWTDWYYDGEVAGTTGQSLRLEAIEIQILEKTSYNNTSMINYSGHVENIGNTLYVQNGETIGTTGQSLRLEGITVVLNSDLLPGMDLDINEHIQDIGWIYGLSNGQYIGTRGKGLRLEAVTMKLKGKDADKYTIKYRAHVENIGWQDWVYDGQIAGTQGQALRIEAIQIKIVKK